MCVIVCVGDVDQHSLLERGDAVPEIYSAYWYNICLKETSIATQLP